MTSDTAPGWGGGGQSSGGHGFRAQGHDPRLGGWRKWLFCELKKGEGASYIRLRLTVILAAAGVQGPQVLQGNKNPG